MNQELSGAQRISAGVLVHYYIGSTPSPRLGACHGCVFNTPGNDCIRYGKCGLPGSQSYLPQEAAPLHWKEMP